MAKQSEVSKQAPRRSGHTKPSRIKYWTETGPMRKAMNVVRNLTRRKSWGRMDQLQRQKTMEATIANCPLAVRERVRDLCRQEAV